MRSDITDIEVQLHARFERAVLISTDGEKDHAEWLPLSQVEVETRPGGTAIITLPEWLAIERGLI